MVKGLLGKKEKVAQLVDKSTCCVDKCLTTSAPLLTSLAAYHSKDCALQAFWRYNCAVAQLSAQTNVCLLRLTALARQGIRGAFWRFFPIFCLLLVESF